MSRLLQNISYIVAIAFIVLATGIICLLVLWGVVSVTRGTTHWIHDAVTISPQEQATIDAKAAEWAKDPTNPDVIAQKCLDRGGTPIISSWDGSVKRCDGTNKKNVNIEVNQ